MSLCCQATRAQEDEFAGQGSTTRAPEQPQVVRKYGFIGQKGQYLIEPNYDGALSFSEQMAVVKLGNSYRFIDHTGKTFFAQQIKGVTTMPGSFNEGFAVIHERLYGFLSKSGKVQIRPRFTAASDFSEGLAQASTGGPFGYIDPQGKWIIAPRFAECFRFAEGLAAARSGNFWGFIDRSGNFVIKPKYRKCLSFSQGLAPVSDGRNWFYINKTGAVVLKGPYEGAYSFSEDMACVLVNKVYRYIDRSGHMLSVVAASPANCKDQVAPALVGDKVGFVDKYGQMLVRAEFDETRGFAEGFAPVRIGNKWGYIDREGSVVIGPVFDEALPFNEGMAVVGIDRTAQ